MHACISKVGIYFYYYCLPLLLLNIYNYLKLFLSLQVNATFPLIKTKLFSLLDDQNALQVLKYKTNQQFNTEKISKVSIKQITILDTPVYFMLRTSAFSSCWTICSLVLLVMLLLYYLGIRSTCDAAAVPREALEFAGMSINFRSGKFGHSICPIFSKRSC